MIVATVAIASLSLWGVNALGSIAYEVGNGTSNLTDFASSNEIFVLAPKEYESNANDSTGIRIKRNPFLLVPAGLRLTLYLFEILSAADTLSGAIQKAAAGGCCQPVIGNICGDGTHATPYCGHGPCNAFGCNCGNCRLGWYVSIYEHANIQGQQVEILGGDTCKNLVGEFCKDKCPGPWLMSQGFPCERKCIHPNDWISSIDTHGHCVRVYEHTNCEGRSLTVQPGSDCHGTLYDCRDGDFSWNDQISSIGPC